MMLYKKLVLVFAALFMTTLLLGVFLFPTSHETNAKYEIINKELGADNIVGEGYGSLARTRIKYLACHDTEFTRDPDVFGTITLRYVIFGSVKEKEYPDKCHQGSLKEFYCKERYMRVQDVRCDFGCYEGACRTKD